MHTIEGGPVFRKLLHEAPALDGPVDPAFASVFNPDEHESLLREQLDLTHLPLDVQDQVYGLIREFWSVFDSKGITVPVKSYECVIDTGSARPIAIKKINYGDHESNIMRKAIAALAKVGHIRQIHDGEWLFKALLAPKPHQEHVRDIDDFVWRFCVNYIPLNGVTRVIAFPIPRCDSAVFSEFGGGSFLYMWLWDAPQGYHQLRVAPESQPKLAFQGTDAIKWTWNVMPFGPTNGPATFINFAHDICSVWQEEARRRGVPIGDSFNTRIIVDDFVNWGAGLALALLYMRCQLVVCQAYNLSLSLPKAKIFPKRFEFVGVDVCPDGNRPASSKHVLLTTWPDPIEVRDVAKFIGFGQFYSRFIPNFELRIIPLRTITSHEYSTRLDGLWTDEAKASYDDIKSAILDDPCIQRFDHTKLIILRTDFSALGFGYVLLQPGDDSASTAAAQDYRDGKGFSFMTKDSRAILRPVCFGARKTRGNETRLHSHLGEGFSGDWAINKCRHYLFAQRFVWVTDCYAIKFILSYEGSNPAVLRLQMRLMCWDVDVVHRPDTELVDADYWSRLGVNLQYDPLYVQYLTMTRQLRHAHPPATDLPMLPENMPYFRGPRVKLPREDRTAEARHVQSLLTELATNTSGWTTPLSVRPIQFGTFADSEVSTTRTSRALYNSEFSSYALQVSQFSWAVFNFSNGHFLSTIETANLSFTIRLGCDPTQRGRSLFGEFAPTAKVFSTGNEFLNHIRSSGDRSVIHGYLINTFRFRTTAITNAFWDLQLQIVAQLRLIHSTSVVVAIIIPDLDGSATGKFVKGLEKALWLVTRSVIRYADIGDSVDDSCVILTAVHRSCAPDVTPIELIMPPTPETKPLGAYIHEPFNRPQYSVCYGRHDDAFNSDDGCQMTCEDLKSSDAVVDSRVKPAYSIRRSGGSESTTAGSLVLPLSSLCPPLEWCANQNLFQHLFGVEFFFDDHTYVRPISAFEFASCFNLVDNIRYRLSHIDYMFALDASMPALTSKWLFTQINDTLELFRALNTEVFTPDYAHAPAAPIQVLLNGAVCSKLPSASRWMQAYNNDSEMVAVKHLVLNPSLISNTTLAEVNYVYRMPLRRSHILLENDMLILREPIGGSTSFTRLQIVPKELYNIIFIAFHVNPIGGHLNAYRTLHRVRLRFYFPHMYTYVKRMCNACPGCALSNPSKRVSSELVYNFPIQAPFMVMHFDAYAAGKHESFEGHDCYLIGCCGMTAFACGEPISRPSAKTFAAAIMKILLRYGICATAVLDKDTKFYGVCREALDLLQINYHVLSGDNHNPMLVERVNRYLNKGLKIMCTERGTVRIAEEAILLLLYAWNSCPVSGTDISRSFVAVGREFAFPIDYSLSKHWELTSTPTTVKSYSKNLATYLQASREVAQLLVDEIRSYHREYINSRRPNPKVYHIGDIVFARRAVKSVKARGLVDKLQFAYTGPWKVAAILDGASYELEHVKTPTRREKKHASDLSPYPVELIAFEPIDGPDSRYGQLHKPISAKKFDEAGVYGFMPMSPYRTQDVWTTSGYIIPERGFRWPTLSDLNNELDWDLWASDLDCKRLRAAEMMEEDTQTSAPIFAADTAPGPPPAPPSTLIPAIPSLEALNAALTLSSDRLFFISIPIGTNDVREWRLVKLDYKVSARSTSCFTTGKFRVDFLISHPADWRYNAVNQRFWIQYYKASDINHPDQSSETHLVRPFGSSETSDGYAEKNNLVRARTSVYLLHEDTFIHGPFDFAVVNNRRTRDRISQVDWDVLAKFSHRFRNPVPRFDVPAYSVHVDNGIHFVFNDNLPAEMLIAQQYRQPRDDASVDSCEISLFSDDEDLLFSDADV